MISSKILSHTRSSSLPSRLSHPLTPLFNHHLHKLKNGNSTSIPSSLSSITEKLHLLEHLYNCIDDLLLLPHTHKVFAEECGEKWVEEILDGYLCLVDACSIAKDSVFQAEEYVLDLLSFLRRRRDMSSDNLSGFLISRKSAKKTIQKSLRNISGLKNKPSVLALEKDQETIAIISMLKEAEMVTLDVFEALLLSICGHSSMTRGSRWSLVSRLMKFSDKEARQGVEFAEMDANLYKVVTVGFMTSSKCDNGGKIDELQQQLRDIDASVQVVEETLDRLFKRLIRTRVSLLNMHSQH
ncbi:hypothetical protein ABFS83_14G123600 [Erythranthe nasuta]